MSEMLFKIDEIYKKKLFISHTIFLLKKKNLI